VTGGKVIRAVEDYIELRDELFEFLLLKLLRYDLHVYFGIERCEGLLCSVDLLRANRFCLVEDLPLQVGEVDLVGISENQPAYAARRQIERRGAAEAAGADDQRGGSAQPLLPFDPDLGEKDVAAVAEELLVVQCADKPLILWKPPAWWRRPSAAASPARP
jgi:hypothetical protein